MPIHSAARWERKPAGYFILEGQEIGHTLQCCHCNGHFLSIRGSGKRRGFCMNCGAVTCGRRGCDRCVPFEKKLEIAEKRNNGLLT